MKISKYGLFTVTHDEGGTIRLVIQDYAFEGFEAYESAITFCIEDIITKLQNRVVEMRQPKEQAFKYLGFSAYSPPGEI